MAFSPDVLVIALQELIPGYSETFTKWHPAFDAIVKKGQKVTAKGPFREFALVPSGPGQITPILTGNEVIAGGRTMNSVRANTYAATMIYAYDVPGQDLREANGEMDLVQLIKRYPERAIMDFHERIAQQLVAGNGAGAGSFPTFNGNVTYDPKGLGARRGAFEYANAAAQTDTVFGVAKNSITGWHNQYRDIASFAAEGRKQMRAAYYDASQEMANAEGDVDLLFGDRGSFDNYLEDLDDQVQIITPSTEAGDRAPSKLRQGAKFLGATFYSDQYIDVTSAAISQRGGVASPAANGLIYGIHSSTWHLYTMGHDSMMETKGDFAQRGPIRHPTQDMWRYEFVLSMGMYCDNLRCNFAVTGGNLP